MWWLLGCAGILEIGGERGPGTWSGPVDWAGYVYASPETGQDTQLQVGTVTFTPDGGEPVGAEQPYANYPGYWSVTLDASVEVQVLLETDGAWPTVWRGRSPPASGAWFAGSLFAADEALVTSYLDLLELPLGTKLADLADGEVSHLWGAPADDGWDCTDVTIAGESALCYVQEEDGSVTRVREGDFDWFFGLNLAPGAVTVDSGRGGTETYQVEGGQFAFAFYFQGAP